MRELLRIMVFCFLTLFLVGCGAGTGGGGGTQETGLKTITYPPIQIPANQASTQQVGDEIVVNVPAGTFPQGSELILTQSQTYEMPSGSNAISDYPILKVRSSANLQGPITISPVDRNRGKDGNYLYYIAQKTNGQWNALNDIVSQPVNSLDLLIVKTKFYSSGTGSEMNGLIGKIKVLGLNTATNLVLFFTDSSAPDKTALLLINGINANAESMRYTADLIRQSHKYREIYAFNYDWRRDGRSVAQDLGSHLDYFHTQNLHVDIVAHSRGVLIARWALEKLGKTNAVSNLYAVCGPNEGSPWASATEILRALMTDYLNHPSNDPPFGLAFTGMGAINEFTPGSDFLVELNTPRNFQRGYVDYCLFAGSQDWLVNRTSALAQNTTMDTLTAKTVETFTFNYNHSGIVHTSSGVADLLNVINRPKSSNIEITTSPQENVNASDDGWYFDVIFKNNGPNQCVLQDQSYDFWGRDGNWVGLNWYSPTIPPGTHFPWQYQLWNRTIAPGETVNIGIHVWPDAGNHMIREVAENNKANYLLLSVKYQEAGVEKQSLCWLILYYNDIWPAYPDARSRSMTTCFQTPVITISEVKK